MAAVKSKPRFRAILPAPQPSPPKAVPPLPKLLLLSPTAGQMISLKRQNNIIVLPQNLMILPQQQQQQHHNYVLLSSTQERQNQFIPVQTPSTSEEEEIVVPILITSPPQLADNEDIFQTAPNKIITSVQNAESNTITLSSDNEEVVMVEEDQEEDEVVIVEDEDEEEEEEDVVLISPTPIPNIDIPEPSDNNNLICQNETTTPFLNSDYMTQKYRELKEYVASVGGTLEEYQHPFYPDKLIRNYCDATTGALCSSAVIYKNPTVTDFIREMDEEWERFRSNEEEEEEGNRYYAPFDSMFVMPPYYPDPEYAPEEDLEKMVFASKGPKMTTRVTDGRKRKRGNDDDDMSFEPPLAKLSVPPAGIAPVSLISSTETRMSLLPSAAADPAASAVTPGGVVDYALRTDGMCTVYGDVAAMLYRQQQQQQGEKEVLKYRKSMVPKVFNRSSMSALRLGYHRFRYEI